MNGMFWKLCSLAYLNDEPGAQVIQDILQLAQQEQVIVYMIWINLGEVYYRLQRLHDRQLARKSIEIIKSWPVNFLEIDEQATLLAGDIKARFRLAYADVFALYFDWDKYYEEPYARIGHVWIYEGLSS